MTNTASSPPDSHHDGSAVAAHAEGRWATFAIAILAFIVVLAAIGGIRHSTMPQYQAETIDPSTLHINGDEGETPMKALLSIFALAIGLAFTVPAFAADGRGAVVCCKAHFFLEVCPFGYSGRSPSVLLRCSTGMIPALWSVSQSPGCARNRGSSNLLD